MADSKIALEVDVEIGDADSKLKKIETKLGGIASKGKKVGENVGKGFKSVKNGASGAVKGLKKFAGGLKAITAAAGIIFLLTEAFTFLKELLGSNQKIVDALGKAYMTIEVVFNNVFNAVGDLIDSFSELSSMSLADVYDALTNFTSAVASAGDGALETADKIIKLRNEVKLAEAEQQLLMLTSLQEAEVQRQIRDDISLTIEKRQAANTKLGEILDDQAEKELALANKRMELAELELSVNTTSIDAQVEVLNAKVAIQEINERITGQRSEQLTSSNALILENTALLKEQTEALQAEAEAEAAAAFKIAEAKISAQKLLDDYLADREGLSKEEEIQREVDKVLDIEDAKFFAAVQAAQEQGVLLQELDELEAARDDEKMRLENEIRAKYAEEDIAHQQAVADALQKIEDDKAKAVEDAEAEKKALREAGFDAASGLLSSLDQLIASSGEQSKSAIALQKTIAVAQIAIDTAKAVVGAIAQAQSVPYPANLIAMATGVAAVVAGIASAVTTLNSAPMGGATAPAPANASTAIASATAPNMEQVSTNTTDLGNTQGAQLAPIQAFVIETEMTGNQQNISQIENQVTFGIDG